MNAPVAVVDLHAKPRDQLTRAERNIRWIERHIRVPEGKYVGQPLVLAEFQRDILYRIYDNKEALTRTALITMPRKAAKTTLCAAIVLLHLAGPEARKNSEIYSAARTRDQASILYKLASKMFLQSPTLRPAVKERASKKELYCSKHGTLYRALSSDASNNQGLSGVLIVQDELGEVSADHDDLFEALQLSTGAQDNPLTIVISTSASHDDALLSKLVDSARDPETRDPRTVLVEYKTPDTVDPFAEEALTYHPAWSSFGNKEELRGMQADAKRIPSRYPAFARYILNQRVNTTTPFISRPIWEEGKATPDDWQGKKTFLALDLSKVSDISSLTVAHVPDGKAEVHVHSINWLPYETILAEIKKNASSPLMRWRDAGLLTELPGRTIGYDFLAQKIMDVMKKSDVQKLAVDPWRMDDLIREMEKAGVPKRWIEERVEPFRQGFQTMSPAINTLEEALLDGRVIHGGNQILTYAINNVRVVTDPKENRKFVKKGSDVRIDPAISMTMAVRTALLNYEVKPKRRGLFVASG